MAASLDQNGNLIIDFQTTSTPLRLVDFNYSLPFIPNGTQPPSGLQADSYLATLKRNEDSDYVALQNMAVGIANAQCVRLGWTFNSQDGATQWRNSFQRNLSPFDISQTSYGVITRTNADTWEVEPKGSSCSNPPSPSSPTVARISHNSTRGKLVHNDDGLYYMPFKLTLRRRG
ncbi:MAG: hypothetical protein H0U81_14030 [Pyrinomonadaceae bacterium]|nr:hypothetical protein [Pyrinomonadaceae bacterium]